MIRTVVYLILFICIFAHDLFAQRANKKSVQIFSKSVFEETALTGLKFRSIGPAQTSGRVADFAVNPNNFKEEFFRNGKGIHFDTDIIRKKPGKSIKK